MTSRELSEWIANLRLEAREAEEASRRTALDDGVRSAMARRGRQR